MRVSDDVILIILSCIKFGDIDHYAEILELSPELVERIKKYVYKKRLQVVDKQYYIAFEVDGILHRYDGPAIEYKNSQCCEWRQNDKLHRLDGPAVINSGDYLEKWYVNGLRHRIGGPAIVYKSSMQEWWQNGKLHREDGPATIAPSGGSSYYIYGVKSKRPKSYKIVSRKKLIENLKVYYDARFLELVK